MSFIENVTSAGIEALAKKRTELRFTGTTEPTLFHDSSFREDIYPNSVINSIYLGSTSLASPLPERGSVRLRFHTPRTKTNDLITFDPNQLVTLEVKLRPQNFQEKGEKNRKYSVSDITIADALAVLKDRDSFGRLDQFANGNTSRRMIELLYEGNGLQPLLMIQSDRRHFIKDGEDPVRMTLDAGISYWIPSFDKCRFYNDGLFFACQTDVRSTNILEIKSNKPMNSDSYFNDLVKELFGENHDYVPAGRVKRSEGLYAIAHYPSPARINPEENRFLGRIEGKEREKKFDIAINPQAILSQVSFNPGDNIFLGPPKPSLIFFRYYFNNDGDRIRTIAEKSEDPDFDHSIFQTKTIISEDGELVREKIKSPKLKTYLNNHSFSQSSTGIRDRIERTVLCTDTGNFFVILADHCTSEDIKPLEQIEIEYLGTLGFSNKSVAHTDEAQIKLDFNRVTKIVSDTFEDTGIKIIPSKTTKEDWLTAGRKQ